MIAEQTIICRYKTAGQDVDIEIQMTVQVETTADPYGSVLTELNYGRIFPEELEDELHQRLYNGVLEGVSLSSIPLIHNSVVVRIFELTVSPSPQHILEAKDKINLSYLLEETITGIIVTLRRSLENLHTGMETYFEWAEPLSHEGDEDGEPSASKPTACPALCDSPLTNPPRR